MTLFLADSIVPHRVKLRIGDNGVLMMENNQVKDTQKEILDRNLDELSDDIKDKLLIIGNKLLSIQNITNKEKSKLSNDEDKAE